jgi:hypothetical protein
VVVKSNRVTQGWRRLIQEASAAIDGSCEMRRRGGKP